MKCYVCETQRTEKTERKGEEFPANDIWACYDCLPLVCACKKCVRRKKWRHFKEDLPHILAYHLRRLMFWRRIQ